MIETATMQYAINIKSSVWHYRDENATLCGWYISDNILITDEPGEIQNLCWTCRMKTKKAQKPRFVTPQLSRISRGDAQQRLGWKLTGVRLEAAQKGYWGIL